VGESSLEGRRAVIYVLDGSAMIAYLRREPGWDVVANLLVAGGNTLFAHAVNLCEVYYDAVRTHSEARARTLISDLLAFQIIPREDMDPAFWQDAGRHKASYRRISLADCFCLALARRVAGELVTSDHREFDPIAPLGLCRVSFIR
jgi:predicted nucleic acid-binding protein